jgi:hypothetical protein
MLAILPRDIIKNHTFDKQTLQDEKKEYHPPARDISNSDSDNRPDNHIRGILKQNYEMLDLRYRLLSQEAVSTLRRQRAVDVYDTVRFILDRYSEKAAPICSV